MIELNEGEYHKWNAERQGIINQMERFEKIMDELGHQAVEITKAWSELKRQLEDIGND
jgi:hypothetical protein